MVLLVRPGRPGYAYCLQLLDGGIQMAHNSLKVQTAGDGRFEFGPQEQALRIIVLHEQGYAEAEKLPASSDIRLVPWARVEGVVKIGGKPVANQKIVLERRIANLLAENETIRIRNETTCDEHGRFVLDKVAPGPSFVGREIEYTRAMSGSFYFDHAVPVHPQAGQTSQVTIGGTGRKVTGRIVAPDGERINFDRTFPQGVLKLPHPGFRPPAEVMRKSEPERMQWYKAWLTSEQGQEFQRAMTASQNIQYFVPIQADGSFEVQDVPPGDYELHVWIDELHDGPAWGTGNRIGSASGLVEVADEPEDSREPVDAGQLQLRPVSSRRQPRAAATEPASTEGSDASSKPSAHTADTKRGATSTKTGADLLHFSIPAEQFERARNDKLAKTWRPLLENEPSKKFDTPKTRASRYEAVVTVGSQQYRGVVLYLKPKKIFYFWGSPLSDTASDAEQHFYGPFSADLLAEPNLR